MLSTPGVRAPLLVLTRRTASHLADRERVNMRQSTLTLPQRCSRTAWAIRLWSRFTSPSAFDQSMIAQSVWPSGTCLKAPADPCRSTVSCFFKFSLAFESLTLRNYRGSQHPLGSGHLDPIHPI